MIEFCDISMRKIKAKTKEVRLMVTKQNYKNDLNSD